MPEKRIGNHAICTAHKEVLSDGGRPVPVWSWVNPISISPGQAALGAMTDGEVGLVLLHRHTRDLNDDAWHRLCKDPELSPMEAETVDFLPRPSPHIFGLLAKKLGLWPPEGAESSE